MSCLGPNYNPKVTRQWGRFENRCAYIPQQFIDAYQENKLIYVPYLNRYIPSIMIQYERDMIKKGNVLEHRQNKALPTKSQYYAQLARGVKFVKKTYATQTETYTNPNILSLKRNNYVGITANGSLINDPITCPKILPIPSGNILPSTGQNTKNPILPPPKPNLPNKNPLLPPVVPIIPPSPVVYPSGGTLQCNVIENICTGAIISKNTITPNCHDTSSSDVPGPIIQLCYRNGFEPWLVDKNRKTYPNSAGQNKLFNFTNETRILLEEQRNLRP